MRICIGGCMSHGNIDMFEGIGIPSKAFWFILELSLKRDGDGDPKVPEAFTIMEIILNI